MLTLALTFYLIALTSLTAATLLTLSTMVADNIAGFLPCFVVIGSGLLLLFGVFAVLWRLAA